MVEALTPCYDVSSDASSTRSGMDGTIAIETMD